MSAPGSATERVSRRAAIAALRVSWARVLPLRPLKELCGDLSLYARLNKDGAVLLQDAFGEFALMSLEDACIAPVFARIDVDTRIRMRQSLDYFTAGLVYKSVKGSA